MADTTIAIMWDPVKQKLEQGTQNLQAHVAKDDNAEPATESMEGQDLTHFLHWDQKTVHVKRECVKQELEQRSGPDLSKAYAFATGQLVDTTVPTMWDEQVKPKVEQEQEKEQVQEQSGLGAQLHAQNKNRGFQTDDLPHQMKRCEELTPHYRI
jgi:hypothetical protein